MIPYQQQYTEFARSLDAVDEREEKTQIVFSVSGHNFCWISKTMVEYSCFRHWGTDRTLHEL